MNVARMDFSDGMVDHNTHQECIKQLKEAMKATKKDCAIVLDTKGPEIRTGILKEGKAVDIIQG
jgi:pyruvate kinase